MNKILLGNDKNGCLIDNENKKIEYYELLNLYEKIKGQSNTTSLSYQDIDSIEIGYSIVNGVRFGSSTLSLTIQLKDHQVLEWPLYFLAEEHQKYIDFAKELLDSHIHLHDKKNILESMINQPQKSLGILLSEIDKKHKKREE